MLRQVKITGGIEGFNQNMKRTYREVDKIVTRRIHLQLISLCSCLSLTTKMKGKEIPHSTIRFCYPERQIVLKINNKLNQKVMFIKISQYPCCLLQRLRRVRLSFSWVSKYHQRPLTAVW